MLGSIISGKLEIYLGRKNSLILIGIIIFLSSSFLGFIENIILFIFLKIIGGLGIGAGEGMIISILSEISPINIKGAIVILCYEFQEFGSLLTLGLWVSFMKTRVVGSMKILFLLNVILKKFYYYLYYFFF